MFRCFLTAAFLVFACSAATLRCDADDSAAVAKLLCSPAKLELQGPQPFRLLVDGETSQGWKFDVSAKASYAIADGAIARVSADGLVWPLADGATEITVSLGEQSVRVPITVVNAGQERPLHFENDIEPILARFGCNMSGCHGKAEGQNGFKLSVFGFDPVADYNALVLEGRGRRVFPAAPDQSLILQKASGVKPHGGGIRLSPDRPEYATLRKWIAAGVPMGAADEPQVTKIELAPRERRLLLGTQQPLRVVATWSDGRTQDVTRLARFQSNNDSLATVDENGRVTVGETPGVVAVMANFMGQVDVFQALIPRGESPVNAETPKPNNFIDEHVYRRLAQLNLVPANVCSDADFLRRVYLDLIGTLPTAAEAKTFLTDSNAHKRAKLVDELLARPEFADYWALKFADLLRVDRQALGHKAAYAQYRWIREALASGKTLDQFAREVLTAEGPLAENPAGYLFKTVPEPGKAASAVSQIFLGVRIECAQCHHHPYDRWSQTDYFGMTAYFAPLQSKKTPQGDMLMAAGNPATIHPRTGKAVPAHPLGMAVPELNPMDASKLGGEFGDKRRELAAWATAPSNPFFAKSWANRVWAHMLGRGIVEPVDDMRATNPPSNPELLDALAAKMVEARFDLRAFLRTIAASRVYQHASSPNETNEKDQQNYSRFLLKSLDAEVLLDAICDTTGVPEKFEGVPAGTKAIALWDSHVDHYFLRLFGRPMRQSVCECERVGEPSVAQVLHLLNSERINEKLRREDGRLHRMALSVPDDGELVNELYLTLFSRFPTSDERSVALQHFAANRSDRWAATEDLAWTMLNSLEFVFNH